MEGIAKFKEYFTGYESNYVVIGGAACGLYAEMARTDMPNSDALKAMGIHGAGAEEVLERLLVAFVEE